MQYTDEEIERLKQHHYLLGIAIGWEQVEEQFRQESGEAFARRADSTANILRDMAGKTKATADERRKDVADHWEEETDL